MQSKTKWILCIIDSPGTLVKHGEIQHCTCIALFIRQKRSITKMLQEWETFDDLLNLHFMSILNILDTWFISKQSICNITFWFHTTNHFDRRLHVNLFQHSTIMTVHLIMHLINECMRLHVCLRCKHPVEQLRAGRRWKVGLGSCSCYLVSRLECSVVLRFLPFRNSPGDRRRPMTNQTRVPRAQ